MKTVEMLLSGGIDTLEKSSPSPRADAMLLLARVLERERAWIAAHGDAVASAQETRAFARLCKRRATGVPIAYLLGEAEFYHRRFIVDQAVLVPRPETEHLVDDAIDFIRGTMRVLDVGTGCGAIACAIAAQTQAHVEGTDWSHAAIDIAKENARRLGLADRCRFHHGNLAEPVRGERFHCIVANLPYIPTDDLPKPPDSASFEPRGALDGGPDGLRLYGELLPQLPPLLEEDSIVLLESAPPTVHALAMMVRATLPHFTISVVADYAGLLRYVRANSVPRGLRAAAAASESGRSQEGESPENRAPASARGARQASAAAVRKLRRNATRTR